MPYNDRLFQLLRALDDGELRAIWTTALQCRATDEEFDTVPHETKVDLVSAKWRAVHGHALANLRRGRHALPWKRILVDVADKLKPGLGWTDYNMDHAISEPELEEVIVGYVDGRAFGALDSATMWIAELALSASYRKSVPATLLLLSAHELRRQLAASK